MDGGGAQSRVGKVAADVVQTLLADPGRDRFVFVSEEAVQVTGGDVVRGGDGNRRQFRIVQVSLDEGTDA